MTAEAEKAPAPAVRFGLAAALWNQSITDKLLDGALNRLSQLDVSDVAVVRVEQLYPIPHQEMTYIFDRYPADCEIVWCQEEPRNQGAWRHIQRQGWPVPQSV